ncbi:M1 family metallopeptidase [Nocardioides sp. ChNu-153]|uniref:M1 family metallopeptidase n=1 Tax=Nocardioides sp. ChNu-153 TaxID=2779364 RepID=UPI002655750A|nr:M1 family metallopeptidase [Nocardioides sp. ChNu-153]MDN7121025.1 M1 family metallopeptidase [Nocardioides sp. ChNu-153]
MSSPRPLPPRPTPGRAPDPGATAPGQAPDQTPGEQQDARGGGARRTRTWLAAGAAVVLLAGATGVGVVTGLDDDTADRVTGGASEAGPREGGGDDGDDSGGGAGGGSRGGSDTDLDPVELPDDAELAVARSTPRTDSVYPDKGHPGVDALHYDIELRWFPDDADDGEDPELEGTTTVTFRSTSAAPGFRLDLAAHLEVTDLVLDGTPTDAFRREGDHLVVDEPVLIESQHRLTVTYRGPAEPAAAPTDRSDFSGVGLTRSTSQDSEDWLWTMQEPYGAFTWYPVNDQPADKALYDVTVRTQPGWTGVANGELVEQAEDDEQSVARFHAPEPMSSYLATVAVGDYELTEDVSDSGVPLTYWTPDGDDEALERLGATKEALAWLEERLGPYPFSSLGSVVVDSESAMETQTMITYGNTGYTLSPEVIVHEIAHHWYGNVVSPDDWSDVWMNEGMSMYLQILWEAEDIGEDVDDYVGYYALEDQALRDSYGPPAAYDGSSFGQSNIYVPPAVMWHELRTTVGDEAFWEMVRAWPTAGGEGVYRSIGRDQYWPWLSEQLGTDLTPFLTAWLLGTQEPPTTFGPVG